MVDKKLTNEEINNLSPRAREAYLKENEAIEIDDDFDGLEDEEE
tara:strand:- start:495 stop:626 length:132 start_codon:yes stop_codon:yes gene_type:complete